MAYFRHLTLFTKDDSLARAEGLLTELLAGTLPAMHKTFNLPDVKQCTGQAVAQFGEQCATSWKVAGSIPDGLTRNFHRRNPFGPTVVLGSIQPLAEMSTRNIS